MSISPISAASLGQSVLAASNSTHLQETLQTLQNSLTSGDLNGAQTALNRLQSLNQNLGTASGNSASSSFQPSTDLTAFGSALSAIYPQRSPPLLRWKTISTPVTRLRKPMKLVLQPKLGS